MQLIDGKATALEIQKELRTAISQLRGRIPRLDVILVGSFTPSVIYVTNKTRACAEVGISSQIHRLPDDITQEELLQKIKALNNNPDVDGILVQFPLPRHIDPNLIMETIAPSKDVDGFNPINRGKLFLGDEDALVPCTPLGVRELLKRYNIATEGKNVTIIGRSNIVGKPLAILLMQPNENGNATVTVAHSKTPHLEKVCAQADILIAAIGQPLMIGPSMVKEGAVVIDVGMNAAGEAEEGKKRRVVGDVDFHAVKDKCSWITPVPGGVGPMTIAMLLSNTFKAYLKREIE
ncbi:MAG: bifunctional 5,10-methylenetetrahydrofolate dehydrogenase/5,10-methenyltetrahydrofolate cyclohydrolase [Parachlamydiales bacterium]|jgi:methylenetetrahydrofolate dehydrogenase (NADP+)/methenyltetrahydrofolate cyclohydrolase